jgi:hypothetical protein
MKEGDDACKKKLQEAAKAIKLQIDSLTSESIDTLEARLGTQIRDLSEATGTKIRTYVAMRAGEENTSNITFNKKNKKVKTPAQAGGGPAKREWGAFSDVFDDQSTNQQKYEGMKDILNPIPDGNTVVVFGYGYSGSGKTYTLLGGIDLQGAWDDGIAQRAIRDYNAKGCTVHLEKAFEMYNDTYTKTGQFGYLQPTTPTYYTVSSRTPLTDDIFKTECTKIETERRRTKHIRPTSNNKESSRGHLFIQLKVTAADKLTFGRMIICDMGGRENPNEMWNSGQYCMSGIKVLGPIVKSDPDFYYTLGDGTKTKCIGGTLKNTSQVFGKDGTSLALAFQGTRYNQTQLDILQTLKQGFYINDSINEMLKVFGYDFQINGKQKSTNWEGIVYMPDVRATTVAGYTVVDKRGVYREDDDKIGIRKIFEDLKKDSDCKIKFCTFACIRPSATFADDSIATLKFAEAVNSCAGLIVNPVDAPTVANTAASSDDGGDDEADLFSTPLNSLKTGRMRDIQDSPAGLPSNDFHKWDFTSQTRQFPGKTNDSSQVGSLSNKNGGSLRKKSKRNKNKNSKTTLKAKSKTNPVHTHQKKKSTRKHKHKKNSSRNKNKSTIKNRN